MAKSALETILQQSRWTLTTSVSVLRIVASRLTRTGSKNVLNSAPEPRIKPTDIDAEMDGGIHPGRPGKQEAAKPLRPAQSHVAQDTSGMWLFLTEPSAQLSSTPGGWLIPSQK